MGRVDIQHIAGVKTHSPADEHLCQYHLADWRRAHDGDNAARVFRGIRRTVLGERRLPFRLRIRRRVA